jgi:predicted nucleic acid-binding protein
MICADTSVFVDFFRGVDNNVSHFMRHILEQKILIMNPFVLSEILSSPKLPLKTEKLLLALPRIDISSSFYERAGYLRRKVYSSGKGATMSDIYIAQACIDSDSQLFANDQDFFEIQKHSPLRIVVVP